MNDSPHLYCEKTLYVLSVEGVFIWIAIIFLGFLQVLSYLIFDEGVQRSVRKAFKQFFRLGVVYEDQWEYELDKGDTTENRFTGKTFQLLRSSLINGSDHHPPSQENPA